MTKKKKSAKKRPFILYNFVKNICRRAFKKTPFFSEALAAAKEEYFIPSKTGKPMRRVHFKCAHCGEYFKNSDVCVDHIDPVIDPATGFVDYNNLIERMFTGKLQVLCNFKGERNGKRSCHYIKTQEEKKILTETNRRKKLEKSGG